MYNKKTSPQKNPIRSESAFVNSFVLGIPPHRFMHNGLSILFVAGKNAQIFRLKFYVPKNIKTLDLALIPP